MMLDADWNLEEAVERFQAMERMTLDQLIAALSKLREQHGGAIHVGISQAYTGDDDDCYGAEFRGAIPDEIIGHVNVGRPNRIVIY
jgi:hypothetical protein